MRDHPSLYALETWEYRSGRWQRANRFAPMERPLTVFVNGQEAATLMASPHDPLTLALGFVANEGWIASLEEVEIHRVCESQDCVDLWLTHEVPGPVRRVFTSGCTGGQTLNLPTQAEVPHPPEIAPLAPDDLFRWLRDLQRPERAPLYHGGRGVHTAGLVQQGRLVLTAEDVGRHNALDRVRGLALLQKMDTRGGILVTTGRISAEMALKAARMGCPVVVSRTAATGLAVDLAQRWGLTLVVYVRGDRFWVYTHPHRIHKEGMLAR